jgi:undecaprenyl-diphosphatase
MDLFFTTITWLGSLYLLLPISVILCFLLLWTGKSEHVIFIALNLSVTILSAHVAKLIFRRPRPLTTDLLVPMPSDWSFPSAHTAQATAFFMSLTLIALQTLPSAWANLFAISSLLLVGIVGYSRIYLQVHYVSDVLAGFFLAAFVFSLAYLIIPNITLLQAK